ncbi:MAG: carbohydrate ABC transporter permease [Oscillospiraceae bacterium]|nr:carbohydrate ABC transporter permease [Oscillospiraceae bacterium]
MRQRKQKIPLRVVQTIVAVFFAALFLFPTVLTITNSFMSQSEIWANYGVIFGSPGDGAYMAERVNLKLIPDMVTFHQFNTVLIQSPDYLFRLWISLALVIPIVLMQVLVASLAAYSFTRFRTKRKEVLFFAYIILMLMPFQVTLVPNYLMARFLNILDTYWSILLPGFVAPFSVFLLTKFMRRIPKSYIEAAMLDGAGEFQIFRRIALPLCKGALYAVAILVFIDYWNMVEQPLIMLSDWEMHPLSVLLSRINNAEIGAAFAVATIYMIPSLLMFLHGEEHLIEGITYSGGIKG